MKLASLILLISASALVAGCSATPSNCAGWKQISLKPATAVYIAQNDVPAGQGIASHNAFGKKAGCW